jgi:hypothetical protein
MSYRLNTHVKPLIWVESVIERHAHSRVEYMIKVWHGTRRMYILFSVLFVPTAFISIFMEILHFVKENFQLNSCMYPCSTFGSTMGSSFASGS